MFSNADEVLKYLKDNDVKSVDVRFSTCPVSCSTSRCRSTSSTRGLHRGPGFDGSSIRGFQAIHESDMQLIPDPTTARLDPFREEKTLNIIFFILDPITGEPYSRDPRNVAKKAEAYLKAHRHRRHRLLRPRGRVLRLRRRPLRAGRNRRLLLHRLDRGRAGTPAATRRAATSATSSRYKGGYFPVPPTDQLRGPARPR